MLKIVQRYKELNDPTISFEFSPPKTESGKVNLLRRIERMSKMNPLFISITWGIGNVDSCKTIELASWIQNNMHIPVCVHLTCNNMTKDMIDNILKQFKECGIKNILALKGETSAGENYNKLEIPSDFLYAIDLVRYIKKNYKDYFCIGVAAYPDNYHMEKSTNNKQSNSQDWNFLLEKVRAGADFVITQLFYDVEKFLLFENNFYHNISTDIPLFPGLMPINSFQTFKKASELSHAYIPEYIINQFTLDIQNNDEHMRCVSISILKKIISQIYEKTQGRIKCFHFYTLNLEISTTEIISNSLIFSKHSNGK